MKHQNIVFSLVMLMSMMGIQTFASRAYAPGVSMMMESNEAIDNLCPDDHHPHLIDLGLPSGTKWACCNVGASRSDDYGDYFAWGETTPKDEYNFSTYKWMNAGQSSWSQINKYTIADGQTSACWYSNGTFVGDGLTELLPEDDAATANWGRGWRMPTIEQYEELINSEYTTTEWTTLNGVNGRKITSKSNGNSIFLPAAGFRCDTSLYSAGSYGYFWSRSLYTNYSRDAHYLYFCSGDVSTNYDYRDYGQSVRPVLNADTNGTEQSYPRYLVVWDNNDAKTTYALKDKPQVTLADDAFVVTKDGQETSFPMGSTKRFTYERIMPGDINGDAKVDIVDVAMTINYLLSVTRSDFPVEAADLNKNGGVDSDDVTAMIALVVNGPEAVAPAPVQQSRGNALYNYRNDGDFNAWLNIDVDSITYSRFDLDGIECDNVVTQEVWTPDSCYRIPIEAIDRIEFLAPEPEFKSDVFHLRQYHMPYVIGADDMTLTLLSSIHTDSIPSVGQVVISDFVEDPLPYGFAGRVLTVQHQGSDIIVTCEAVGLTDIFDRLQLVGRTESYYDDDDPAAARPQRSPLNSICRRSEAWGDDNGWDGTFSFKLGKISFGIPSPTSAINPLDNGVDKIATLSIKPKLTFNYLLDIRPFRRSTVKVQMITQTTTTVTASLKCQLKGLPKQEVKMYLTDFSYPIVPGLFYFDARIGGKIELAADAKLKATMTKTNTVCHDYYWDTSMLWPEHTRRTDYKDPKADDEEDDGTGWQSDVEFDLDGSFGFAASLDCFFFLVNDKVLTIGNTFSIGPEIAATISLNTSGILDGSVYNTLKNTKITMTGLKLSDDINYIVAKKKYTIGSYETGFFVDEYKLFPDFTKPVLSATYGNNGYEPLALYSVPSNDVIPIIPLKLGIAAYNEQGEKKDEMFAEPFYQKKDEWNDKWLKFYLLRCERGKKYTFRPSIKMWGSKYLQLKASPENTFVVPLKLSTSKDQLTMKLGDTATFDIIDGWGDFSVTSSDTKTATISQSTESPRQVAVTGKKLGTTQIKVSDCRSQEEAVVTVNVVNTLTLALSATTVGVKAGSTAPVEIVSGSGNYSLSVLGEEHATAVLSGTTVIVTGIKEGAAIITVSDNTTGETASINVIVTSGTIPDPGNHEWVDLGLPSGTLWATCNVGASSPEEYGDYFAWGETTPKDTYNWSTYIHCDGSSSTCHDIGSDIAGTEYDAATANWGAPWRMPSFDQVKELLNNTTSEWTTLNGVYGRKFTGSNGGTIFLPAAGYSWYGELSYVGSDGFYYSSTPHGKSYAYELSFDSGYARWYYYLDRDHGRSVRPVR